MGNVARVDLKVYQRGGKKKAQTHVFVVSRSFLLNHLEPNYTTRKTKLLLFTIPIGIVEYAVTLLWDNFCRNSCIFLLLCQSTVEEEY